MKSLAKTFIGNLMLVAFVSTLFFSLFHGLVGMNMGENTSSCLFMSHEEVVCPMSLFDHIKAWQTSFLSVMPAYVSLLTFFVFVYFEKAPNLLFKIKLWLLSIPIKIDIEKYSIIKLFQELFSDGILHPKLFN
ncbi:MAG: hypothetical protein R3B60_02535 [Candidatus Paceibacterota bacterium]